MNNHWVSNGQPLDFEWTTIGFGLDNHWIWIGQPLDLDWTTIGFGLDNQWIWIGQPVDFDWTGTFNFEAVGIISERYQMTFGLRIYKCYCIQSTRSGNRFPSTNARIQWATSRLLRMVDVPRTNSKVQRITM